MLGSAYTFFTDNGCVQTFTRKQEVARIRAGDSAHKHNTSSAAIMPEANFPSYNNGYVYSNAYINYCCGAPFSASYGFEFLFNNQIVTLSKITGCFYSAPIPVQNKQYQKIGQLRANNYMWKYLCGSSLCPDCMSLDVANRNFQRLYRIQKTSCLDCQSYWAITDSEGLKKGKIRQDGCCSYNYDFTLPEDTDTNKLLILAALPYLP